ncbi:T-cell receptor-associated transmembrane adapter 1-like isoform X2 [Carcharodon carcharias]|uniref:T-cell receptor-associated transmembrane adapter 1-like isoform X2 n=1 Tax=Carcharodon carcharias TaxID=13397 RepID=UPI001B7E2AF8|nr:T-cell receptor-associated transmembrane adapter 1-like isoform X2 [Carcharodon carcharias]
MDEIAKCHIGIWGLLGICILALMTSLVVNVIYCTANRQKAPRAIYQSVKQLQSPVIQEVDDNPIYGNLNQDTTGEDESCYEAMTPTNRYGDETKVMIESQMCYASLDLSVEQKKRRRNLEKQRTNNDILEHDNMPLNTHALTSRPSIYLNSEQLSFNEDRREETIHDDPVILYGRINTSQSKLSVNDTAMAFDNTK